MPESARRPFHSFMEAKTFITETHGPAQRAVKACHHCGREVVAVKGGGEGYITISPNPSHSPWGAFAGGNLPTPPAPVVLHICNPCVERGKQRGTFAPTA
jgi:hypothetical protein